MLPKPLVLPPQNLRNHQSLAVRKAGGTVQRDSHGRIERSASALREFMHSDPCPFDRVNERRMPGYIVDHVQALECGGASAMKCSAASRSNPILAKLACCLPDRARMRNKLCRKKNGGARTTVATMFNFGLST